MKKERMQFYWKFLFFKKKIKISDIWKEEKRKELKIANSFFFAPFFQ